MTTDRARKRETDLREAFEKAEYHVLVGDEGWQLRAGERHPGLDRDLECGQWAILTAHNPGGRRLEDRKNRKREAALRQDVAQRGWRTCEAVNRDPEGTWPDEPALLIADAPLAEVEALARLFGQAAILTARAGEPARVAFVDCIENGNHAERGAA